MEDLDFMEVAQKLVEAVEKKMESQYKKKKDGIDQLPISRDTWYNLVASSHGKAKSRNKKGITLGTIFLLSKYADVSVDYLLGFKDTPYQWLSKKNEDIDFGFTNITKQNLRRLNIQKPLKILESKNVQFSPIDLVNFIINRLVYELTYNLELYFQKLEELDEFESNYVIKKTGQLKTKKMTVEDAEILGEDYNHLKREVKLAKAPIDETINEFLNRLWVELNKGSN